MEKINVTNVKISFSDREDVKNHDLTENPECCNFAKVVTRKRMHLRRIPITTFVSEAAYQNHNKTSILSICY